MDDLIAELIATYTVLTPITIALGSMIGTRPIKNDIYNLEQEIKETQPKTTEDIQNNIDQKYHYLLRSKKLQKHFDVEFNNHSDRYNFKEFWKNRTNKDPLTIGGVITPLFPQTGPFFAVTYKLGYKIAQRREINKYIKSS